MSERLERTIAIGLMAAVVLTALSHGAVEAWSLALFELLIALLILLWVFKSAAQRRLRVVIPSLALPIAALLAVGLVQSVSLGGTDAPIRSLSMDVEATRMATIVLFFLLVSFLISVNFLSAGPRFRTLMTFLIVFGMALAVFALIQHLTWDGRFYWFRPTRHFSVFGPFVNRNHYAGYMAMLIPMPVALILNRGVRREAWLLFGFAAAFMGLTVFISLSRGGMISTVAGLMFVALMSGRKAPGSRESSGFSPARLTKRIGALAVIAVAIAAGVFWIGAEGVINRAAQTIDDQARSNMEYYGRNWLWKDTLRMFSDSPILGVGLGAFETVHPIYTQSDGSMVVQYAHNDYLQLISDAGVVGGLIGVWFLVLLFRAISRGTGSADPMLSGLALGCGGGIFALLVHSLFDFNLQIPSNCLLFLVLTAVVSNVAVKARDEVRIAALKEHAGQSRELATGVTS